MMAFQKEADFEAAFVNILFDKGWENEVLNYPTEQALIENWAKILFANNRTIDRLNNCPLTDGEMRQIMEQIAKLKTPLKLNGFINGKTVTILRDHPDDTLHFGKEVSLKIYDRGEIAAGQSRYQIARQPQFAAKSTIQHDRRGDLMLLINGMPVIHVELKRSGVKVSQVAHQIETYAHEGIFTGLFSLIQIFVAMEPEEALYFANPGVDGQFNRDFYFHWADFNNEPLNHWKDIASNLLSIPMAHQLIGFYTVADDTDGALKVMRSYQYYAANAISDRVAKIRWEDKDVLGGYVWHTTGSGKTMTSFKSAQLIANSKDADKVLFLMDRIELGTQSLKEYRSFAEEHESVQATENTVVLIAKLKSSNPQDTLIVTSIQKMSNIKDESDGLYAKDIELIKSKRIVFIVDEAHRSTFGDMLVTIKHTFPSAIFFGFTGTPIQEENQKKMNTTATIFGDELHRYSIADGIRDKNVLGFDPYRVTTFKDRDVRKAVALHQAKASDKAEAIADEKKSQVYLHFMNAAKVKMAGYRDDKGHYIKGIEDYLPDSQYKTEEHQQIVAEDIRANWKTLSYEGKFHALFATNSIPEAIAYYRRIKQTAPELKVTSLFDPNIDHMGGAKFKEDGLIEIMQDYNARYKKNFTLSSHAGFKRDIASRLAHKDQYNHIEKTPDEQIDLLIVVDQMLTGFDSKWINTLYLDKVLEYENIIQAFSRTNRLFGKEKPFGTIRYYRRPHKMEKYIENAVKLYSGDKPLALFVDKLEKNLTKMNAVVDEISEVFSDEGIFDFERLPNEISACGKFASLFKKLNDYLDAAKIQGFDWSKSKYQFSHEKGRRKTEVEMKFEESVYLILALRYKELFESNDESDKIEEAQYDIVPYLTEIDTGIIDANYMNSRFDKYLKLVRREGVEQTLVEQALNDLHKTFAALSQEEQKYANIFLHDIQRGDASLEDGKTLRDYITERQARAKEEQICRLVEMLGVDEAKLRYLLNLRVTPANINEYGRFDELKYSIDKTKAREYFEKVEGTKVTPPKVNIKADQLLRKFVLVGGCEITLPDSSEV